MSKRTPMTVLAPVAATLLALSCGESVAPERTRFGTPYLDVVADQNNGTLGANGTAILKGFNPTNPRRGAAIVATFFWLGSTNIITSVGDHLTDGTPVGNTYTLVDYVTAGGISMATYVATNVQNFPDPNPDQDRVLVVQANLSTSITDGGVMLSAYGGVQAGSAQALGAHRSASGSGSAPTTAAPGAVAANNGALVYGVTMSNRAAGIDRPAGFTYITSMSDAAIAAEGDYAIRGSVGSVDAQWTWFFDAPSTWLATVLTLNSAEGGPGNQPPTAAFTSSCSGLACTFSNSSSDPDGTIASSQWNFGDGTTSTAQSPSHPYAAAGTHTVSLTVTDNQGATGTVSHSVTVGQAANQSPVAEFTSSCSELACNFTSTSSDPDGSIAAFEWTFGDASGSAQANPSHSYGSGGSYTVTLRVTDDQGATSTASHAVTVTATPPNQPPLVDAGPNETVLTGLLYTLRASFSDPNDTGPWSYTINWGDGSTTTGNASGQGTISAGHTYVTILPRSFTITVTVRDSHGASASDTKVVSVILL